MKSIELYVCRRNNIEKGRDGRDSQDTVVNTHSQSVSSLSDDSKQEIIDECELDEQIYLPRCYILWGQYHRSQWKSSTDRRVYDDGKAKTIRVELKGRDKQDALSKLDTNVYEFIEW